ncbi:hypothetical protein C6500_05155 [Candidatus Poribacteria bacterium]|nr:MAG: hypothetical protein C6500_05155 [Candidatus Poribacteria bacterium]
MQRHSSPVDVTTATSGVVLSLTTPRLTYASDETIPLELSIQGGESDLLVPFVNVATSGAFTHLKVTDTNGNVIEPKRSIPMPNTAEIFIETKRKSIQCIRGFALKSTATQVASLADLRKYYELQKGNYTITLTMELPIYRDFLKKRNPEVIELEEEIKRIKKVTDAHVSTADKRSAVNDLQQQIERLEKKSNDIYLPVRSLRGKASLTSNSITLTIE